MASSSKKTQSVAVSPTLTKLANQSQTDFELEFLSGLLDRHPNYVEALKIHAKNLASVRRHFEGLMIDRRIARLRPTDSLAHYNLACSLALTYHKEEALIVLRKAVEMGYRDFEFIKEDRDLDSIRKDPRFRLMIREFERR